MKDEAEQEHRDDERDASELRSPAGFRLESDDDVLRLGCERYLRAAADAPPSVT